jgi:formamidopyrimidine-DNA glycosylase
MPELPEVETTANELRPYLLNETICAAHILWPRTVAEPGVTEFEAGVAGRQIMSVGRRGKYLVFVLDNDTAMICHLRMTGRLRVEPPDSSAMAGPHVRAWFELGDGRHLVFSDPRKFGRLWWVPDAGLVTAKLGPEPLDLGFSAADLGARLRRRRVALKALLLDQSVVAGLGNIYADEALFRARLHPLRTGASLSDAEVERLHASIVELLHDAVRGRGTTLRDYRPPMGQRGNFQDELQVYQRTDQPCVRCGAPIRRIRVTQRSTHFCPNCQQDGSGVD